MYTQLAIQNQKKLLDATFELAKSSGKNKTKVNVKKDFSKDYPLGGLLEPFDIGRDKQLTK